MAETPIIYTPEMYTGPSYLVHLHNHTIFSTLDGCATPEQYAEQCKKRGYPAMAVTEHGHMASVPDFYLAFKKQKIKPIMGCEIYYCDWEPQRHQLESDGVKIRSPEWRKNNVELAGRIIRARHLTVLAKNETGFHNLVKLTTQAYETGLFGMGVRQFNRIWFEKLCEYKEGLIVLSGCLNGPICHELRFKKVTDRDGNVVRDRTKAERLHDALANLKKFKAAFGEDYYIELQMPGVEDDVAVFHMLIEMANRYKIKIVLANDCHYLRREDHRLQKIMMAIAQETSVHSKDLFHVNSDEQFMKTRAELWARFKNCEYSKGVPDSDFELMCDNTLEVADKVRPFDFDADPKIPDIKDADDELCGIVVRRLKELGLDKSTKRFIIDGREVTYFEQSKIELKRFIDKGFSSYFIITRELIKYGRQRGWPFSPRGCAVPTELVGMADGTDRQISDISVGDLVCDGFGQERLVENKFVYDVCEDLVVIEFDGGSVTVTADHKLYVVRDGVVCLLRAADIKDSDEVIEADAGQIDNHENS